MIGRAGLHRFDGMKGLVVLALLTVPTLCFADGGLIGIVVFGYIYLFLTETLAVGVETFILKRWYDANLKRTIPWLLVGNFISTVVGLGLPMQMAFDAYKSHGKATFGSPLLDGFMYNVFPILYLTGLSIVIEWPFYALALKRKVFSWSTFKASLICNLISPLAIIALLALLVGAVELWGFVFHAR